MWNWKLNFWNELLLHHGWMTCNFSSFSIVFQSYQDDEKVIMKGCGEKPHLWLGRFPPQLKPGTTRPVDQCLTHWSTGVIISSSMCTHVKSHQAFAQAWSLSSYLCFAPFWGRHIVHLSVCPSQIVSDQDSETFEIFSRKCKAQSEDVQIENKYRNFFTYILKKLCLWKF